MNDHSRLHPQFDRLNPDAQERLIARDRDLQAAARRAAKDSLKRTAGELRGLALELAEIAKDLENIRRKLDLRAKRVAADVIKLLPIGGSDDNDEETEGENDEWA